MRSRMAIEQETLLAELFQRIVCFRRGQFIQFPLHFRIDFGAIAFVYLLGQSQDRFQEDINEFGIFDLMLEQDLKDFLLFIISFLLIPLLELIQDPRLREYCLPFRNFPSMPESVAFLQQI